MGLLCSAPASAHNAALRLPKLIPPSHVPWPPSRCPSCNFPAQHKRGLPCAYICAHLEHRVAVAGNLLKGRPLAGQRLQAGSLDALQRCAGHALLILGIHARQQICQEQAKGPRLLCLVRNRSRLVEEGGTCMQLRCLPSHLAFRRTLLQYWSALVDCTLMLMPSLRTKTSQRRQPGASHIYCNRGKGHSF